ncbi:MAG: PAS domain S-box protein [Candidatus Ranarchaeia archaeon]
MLDISNLEISNIMKNHLDSIINNSPEGIVITNLAGKIINYNKKFLEITKLNDLKENSTNINIFFKEKINFKNLLRDPKGLPLELIKTFIPKSKKSFSSLVAIKQIPKPTLTNQRILFFIRPLPPNLLENHEQSLNFFEVGLDGKFKKISKDIVKKFGYTKEEIYKMNPLDIIAEHDKERGKQSLHSKLIDKYAVEVVRYDARTKTGKILPVIVKISQVIKNNKVIGIRGIIFDLEEVNVYRKIIEQQDENLKSLIENASWGILIVTDHGLVYANKQLDEILGTKYSEYSEKKIMENKLPSFFYKWKQDYEEWEKDKKYPVFETQYKRENGKKIDLEMNVSKITWFNEQGMLITINDITLRKNIELKFKQKREEFENFMEAATDGFTIYDSKLNYLEINKIAIHKLNLETKKKWKKEQILGKNILDFSKNVVEMGIYDKIQEVLKTGLSVTQEVSFKIGNNTQHLIINLFKVGSGVGQICTDVSKIKETEKKLMINQMNFSSFIDSADNDFVIFDSKLHFVSVNKAFLKRNSLKEEDVIGKLASVVKPNVVSKGYMKKFKDVLRTGKSEVIEDMFVDPLAGNKYKTLNIFKVGDGVGVVSHDTTKQKLVEAELQKQHILYNQFMDSATHGFEIYDENLELIEINLRALELRNFEKNQVMGKNILDLYKKPKGNYLNLIFKDVLRSNNNKIIEDTQKDPIKGLRSFRLRIFRVGNGVGIITEDVTEKIQIEKKLRESKEILNSFMDSATDSFIIVDSEIKIMECNDSAREMLGIKKSEIYGKYLKEVTYGLEEKGILLLINEVFQNKVPITFEDEYIHPKLGQLYLIVRLFRVVDGVGIIFSDVTNIRKVEKELRESEEQLNSFMASAIDGFSILDSKLKLVKINESSRKLMTIGNKNVIGKHILDITPSLREKSIYNHFEQVLKSGKSQIVEETIDYPSGEKKVLSLKLFKVGSGLGIITQDLTERKAIEKSIRITQGRLSSFLNSATDGFILLDKELKIIQINKKIKELTNVKIQKIVDSQLDILVPNLISKKIFNKIKRKSALSDEFNLEDIYLEEYQKPEDKRDKHLLVKLFKVRPGFGIIISDISRYKVLEQQLRQYSGELEVLVNDRTSKLQNVQEQLIKNERMAVIGEVAAMVSHDLKNPLQSITNAMYLLKTKLAKEEAKKYSGIFNIIDKSVEQSVKIISDILDYSKQKQLNLEKYQVKNIFDFLFDTFTIPRNIKVELRIPDDLVIMVDYVKITRAFTNLIMNSIEAMTSGGELSILVDKEEEFVSFKIKDTGVGMPESQLKTLWKPLLSTKAQGTGLGLLIARRYVEAHNGSIQVISKVDLGTTFVVAIPIDPTIVIGKK